MSARKHIDWNAQPLGLLPDSAIAIRVGCAKAAVWRARAARGVAPCPRTQPKKRPTMRHLVQANGAKGPLTRIDTLALLNAPGRRTRAAIERCFWAKVNKKPDGCWPWTGPTDSAGYGYTKLHGIRRSAHQVSMALAGRSVATGLTIDHLCRNRACVNPAHLEAVTMRVNTLRGASPPARNAAKTHCANGHEFNQENTWVSPAGARKPRRLCRACQRENDRRRRRR